MVHPNQGRMAKPLDTDFAQQKTRLSPKVIEEEGSIKFEIKAALADIPDHVFLKAGYSANADIILNKINQVAAVQERDVIYEKRGYGICGSRDWKHSPMRKKKLN